MSLDRDQIIRETLKLLDESGVQGLNMRALGARLDAAPTAVYWHVRNKDELLVAAADEVWQEISLLDPDTVGWRAAAAEMARGLYAMVIRHPWLATLMSTHLVYGIKKARHDDHGLAVYAAAGFSARRASDALLTVTTFVLGNALAEAAEQTRLRRGPLPQDQQDAELAQVLEIAAQFPRLSALMADHEETADDGLGFGLDLILGALEQRATSSRP